MKKISILFCLLLFSMSSQAQNRCKIVGEVIDRPQNDMIYLTNDTEDSRVSRIEVPVKDGKFEIEFEFGDVRKYTLNFDSEVRDGSWMPVAFFPKKNATIHFKIYHRDNHEKNEIKGGSEEKNINKYKKVINVYNEKLNQHNETFENIDPMNSEGKRLTEMLDNETDSNKRDSLYRLYYIGMKNKSLYSKEGIEFEEIGDSLYRKLFNGKVNYISKNINFHSYSLLVEASHMVFGGNKELGVSIDEIKKIAEKYAKKYPKHIYTKIMEEKINALDIKPGNMFRDFEAPDKDGNIHTLSSLIKGKVAILNLWASWCGPCRKHGIEIIPLYEKYKDRGFTVVGVAKEDSIESMVKASNRDGYKWINLIDLKGKYQIWEKYGIANAGGVVIMIDRDGKILAISPTVKEIEKRLKALLGE